MSNFVITTKPNRLMKKFSVLFIVFLFHVSFAFTQNQTPVIVNDTFIVKAGTSYVFYPLLNDYDPDGDHIYIHYINSSCSIGKVESHNDTSFVISIFYSDSNWDSLMYSIVDEQNTVSNFGVIYFKVNRYNVIDSLSVNNIGAKFYPLGNYFWDLRWKSLYQVPAGSGKTTIFTMEPGIGGLDSNGVLHLAANRYFSYGSDWKQGPMCDSAANMIFADSAWSRIWKITKAEIDYHRNHYWNSSYIMPEAIAHWPGNGDVSQGMAPIIAPFYDKNGNGIYEPQHGDYPLIKGDESIFMLFNDEVPHTETNGKPLKIEFHVTAYAYQCSQDSAFDHTIFLHYEILNRSGLNYHDVYFGLWTDFDIGYSQDDYLGCDTNRNIFFGYNGKNTDGFGTTEAYGVHPPAQGVTFLNKDLRTFMGFRNVNSMPYGDPQMDQAYYNSMRAYFNDTTHLTYGGSGYGGNQTTNWMYPGDPSDTNAWSQNALGDSPADIRGLGSYGPFNLKADSVFILDVALTTARDMIGDNISSVTLLKNYIDQIQSAYDNDSTPCGGSFSGFMPEKDIKQSLKLYPVPATHYLYVDWGEVPNNAVYEIYNISGKRVKSGIKKQSNHQKINIASLPKGLYFMVVSSKNGLWRQKFVIAGI